MGLFGFGKKQQKETACDCGGACAPKEEVKSEACDCGGACDKSAQESGQKAKIIVLGACCKKSSETFENVKTAVLELGLNETVENIGDNIEIAKYGVMQTPALVINNKVLVYGRALSVKDAKNYIEKAGIKQ